jgi:hypothetical protein
MNDDYEDFLFSDLFTESEEVILNKEENEVTEEILENTDIDLVESVESLEPLEGYVDDFEEVIKESEEMFLEYGIDDEFDDEDYESYGSEDLEEDEYEEEDESSFDGSDEEDDMDDDLISESWLYDDILISE